MFREKGFRTTEVVRSYLSYWKNGSPLTIFNASPNAICILKAVRKLSFIRALNWQIIQPDPIVQSGAPKTNFYTKIQVWQDCWKV